MGIEPTLSAWEFDGHFNNDGCLSRFFVPQNCGVRCPETRAVADAVFILRNCFRPNTPPYSPR